MGLECEAFATVLLYSCIIVMIFILVILSTCKKRDNGEELNSNNSESLKARTNYVMMFFRNLYQLIENRLFELLAL